jgi:hypothetical protein
MRRSCRPTSNWALFEGGYYWSEEYSGADISGGCSGAAHMDAVGARYEGCTGGWTGDSVRSTAELGPLPGRIATWIETSNRLLFSDDPWIFEPVGIVSSHGDGEVSFRLDGKYMLTGGQGPEDVNLGELIELWPGPEGYAAARLFLDGVEVDLFDTITFHQDRPFWLRLEGRVSAWGSIGNGGSAALEYNLSRFLEVPEPATGWLLAGGLAALGLSARRRRGAGGG